ncbi:Dynein assembly factor 4, axonemal [Rhizophlyctis rosea]|uniref:Dynein axonemal assembly factor 4 n=1 Tax=Rhizophlyctis rosea TaxID=64517 RepID=A0AAD5X6S5_9FUNG|nr:Dynein assembly factor 4, axonemal [Rhizophlyctis rosea]
MPIVIKDYTWTESDETVYITVPLKGINANKADFYANDEYIKVNYPPHFFELDLYASVDSESAVAAVGDGSVKFTLTKKAPKLWNTVKTTITDIEELKQRRTQAEQRAYQRQQEIRQEKLRLKRDQERELVQKQIEVERAERERVAALKEEEKRTAQVALAKWTEEIKSVAPSTGNDHEGGGVPVAADGEEAVVDRLREGDIFDEDDLAEADDVGGKALPESGITETGDEEEEGSDDEKGIDMEAIRAKVQEQLQGKSRPPPRAANAEIEITFTSRGLIPTKTARESEDAKWQAKISQAQAAHKAQQDKSDAKGIEEENPVFLKDKGNDFYRKGNFPAAINAYTAALQLDPKNLTCLSNRAASHLHLSNHAPCISDCDQALSLLKEEELFLIENLSDTPEASEKRRKATGKILLRRGAAKAGAGNLEGAKVDYEKALELDPRNDAVKADLVRLESVVR